MSPTTCGRCDRPTGGAVLCPRCSRTFAHTLVNVGTYSLDMLTIETKRSRYGSGAATKGSIGKSQPLPVDTRFVDAGPAPEHDKSGRPRPARIAPAQQLGYDTWATVVAWCRVVMEDQPQHFGPEHPHCLDVSCARVRRTRWPESRPSIPTMLRYLQRQAVWIVHEPWAPDILDELLDLERRLSRFVDRPADRWYAGKCSALVLTEQLGRCQVDLYASTERGTIMCPGCGTEHDVSERREILLEEAKEYAVTATEAAGALIAWTDYDGSQTKLVDRIRKWRDRGTLEVREVTSLKGQDRHLYRLGDVQDLLVGDAQFAQSRRLGIA